MTQFAYTRPTSPPQVPARAPHVVHDLPLKLSTAHETCEQIAVKRSGAKYTPHSPSWRMVELKGNRQTPHYLRRDHGIVGMSWNCFPSSINTTPKAKLKN
jgi:hypothetical protein